MRTAVLLLVVLFAASGLRAESSAPDPALTKAIGGPQRSAKYVARDPARHPGEELAFFDIRPELSVVEIWPSGGYWTEILAPYLRDRGHYTLAIFPGDGSAFSDSQREETEANDKLKAKLAAEPATYGKIALTALGKGHYDIAPPGSADLIVTFRNLHNWMDGGYADEAMAAFYKALKPGGILGVEDHRAATAKPQDPKAESGYVRQDYAIALAKKAGFELVGSSEVNANPKDTTDWPKGVWTLPPSYALGDQDRAKYAAIGEADNFVLKFHKPAK